MTVNGHRVGEEQRPEDERGEEHERGSPVATPTVSELGHIARQDSPGLRGPATRRRCRRGRRTCRWDRRRRWWRAPRWRSMPSIARSHRSRGAGRHPGSALQRHGAALPQNLESRLARSRCRGFRRCSSAAKPSFLQGGWSRITGWLTPPRDGPTGGLAGRPSCLPWASAFPAGQEEPPTAGVGGDTTAWQGATARPCHRDLSSQGFPRVIVARLGLRRACCWGFSLFSGRARFPRMPP